MACPLAGAVGALCLAACCGIPAHARDACTLEDATALVQVHAGGHQRGGAASVVSSAVQHSAKGPLAHTQDGPVRGVEENGCFVFKKIPYVEPPERFARSVPKRPWAPKTLDATRYGPGCPGSHTGVAEDESCLNLNIWLPKGGHQNMPVIVYMHGGMNQHGSGQEPLRQGDGITQSSKYPTIFVNFDFRLGIFGWFEGFKELNISSNLGLFDQQNALRWVQRNIAAFGGDPSRVTLQGQSEGAGIILVHMVAPGSAGLFHRAIFHSPPADMWSPEANQVRTAFMVQRSGCRQKRPELMLRCLKKKDAQALWNLDWVAEELSRDVMSGPWMRNAWNLMRFMGTTPLEKLPGFAGWHGVVDGHAVPGEPRELIAQGRWNKVPVLLTVSKNESLGIFPSVIPTSDKTMMLAVSTLSRKDSMDEVEEAYKQSLEASGIQGTSRSQLHHQMFTDKMWTCDIRSLARDIVKGGGQAYVGMFWHSPRYDPVGKHTNAVCEHGATCHAAEMLYALPQGHGVGIANQRGLEAETEFANKYRDEVLAFVHGAQMPWKPYDTVNQSMTFYDAWGPRVVPRYRKEQCDILDASMREPVPQHLLKQAQVRL